MKDEALALALKALKSAAAELYRASSYCNTYEVLANTNDAIIATQQALAAPVQPIIGSYLEKDNSQFKFSDYESDGVRHNKPAVPDALNPRDENPAYAAGWNDCRVEMLKGMKP